MAPEDPHLRYLRLRRQLRSARATWAAHLRACEVCRAAPATGEGRCGAGRLRWLALLEAKRVFGTQSLTLA